MLLSDSVVGRPVLRGVGIGKAGGWWRLRSPERGSLPRTRIRWGRHLFAKRPCIPAPRRALLTRGRRVQRLPPLRLSLHGVLAITPILLHVRALLRRDRGPARLPLATVQRITLTARHPRRIPILTRAWLPLRRSLRILLVAEAIGSSLPLFLTRPALRLLVRIALAARRPGISLGKSRTRLPCRSFLPSLPFRLPLLTL